MRAGAHHFRHQNGVALAISLVLLVALTILGLATMTGSRLNEKMASNAQQKAIAFEVAESAIYSVWTYPDIMAAIDAIPSTQINNPDPIYPADANLALADSYDQNGTYGVSVDINAEVSVQYCGERLNPIGGEMSIDESQAAYVDTLFNINGRASIENSHASAEHVQRGRLTLIQTHRTANCTDPG